MTQGIIIKALSGFYYIESDGVIYQLVRAEFSANEANRHLLGMWWSSRVVTCKKGR